MISIKNLSVNYFGNEALKNVNLDIPLGYTIGIIGPNGAGKSTLLKAILEIIPVSSGTVLLNGKNIKPQKKNIAYVPQKSEIDLSFPITVKDAVLCGTYPNIGLFRNPTRTHRDIADKAMAMVSIENLASNQVNNLSGGQLQRVFIARALAQEADIFFLDEPFVGIDLISEMIIIELLSKLKRQGKTILIVHHDLHEVASYFDKIVILNKEIYAFGDVKEVFTSRNIKKAYGAGFESIAIEGMGE